MTRLLRLFPLALLVAVASADPPESRLECFVTRDGDRLMEGDEELRFVSWNVPNLLVLEDAFEFLGESPWRWPDASEIADALDSVRQMGSTVVRTYVLTVRREGADMGEHVHVLGPGEFNERAFETLDLVLKLANERGVRIILPLVDNWKWQGGIAQYAAFRGKRTEEFWTDRQLIQDFKQTIHFVLNRRNTLTGVLYRNDPAILCWETGNELDSPAEWTAEIAAYIKSIDSNHLVLDGRSLKGFPYSAIDDPNIDLISTHHYPGTNNSAADIAKFARLARGKKPYFVGEFGFVEIDEARKMLNAVIDEGAAGALYWSLRYHRRDGGFYWHHEPSGGDLYKAYHWPGFEEGREYREHLVIPMIRNAAFRIRDLEPPPVDPPAPPVLLPIEHPGRISWRGSAGASHYRVERADAAEGPWIALADRVSDAATQYRPLYCDSTATPGDAYYYRAVALNEAGASEPSNIVGPVKPRYRMLVDELADLSLVESTSGKASLCSNEARKVQEDIHRLALQPGASVTYRTASPLISATAYLFSENPAATLEIAYSRDGARFVTSPVKRDTIERREGDYGYLTPVLLRADLAGKGARFVRFSLPSSENKHEAQLSRVELNYGD